MDQIAEFSPKLKKFLSFWLKTYVVYKNKFLACHSTSIGQTAQQELKMIIEQRTEYPPLSNKFKIYFGVVTQSCEDPDFFDRQ